MGNQYGTRLDDYGFEKYEENAFPIAYLITFRTFGTWLHGDERGSMQRSRDRRFRTVKFDPNVPLNDAMRTELKQVPVVFSAVQREIVEAAIRETCEFRNYGHRASNVRTNHAHTVISAAVKPEKIANDLKVNATRRLREAGELDAGIKIWARGASTRYLWKPAHVAAAVDYVLYSQGDTPLGTVTEMPED